MTNTRTYNHNHQQGHMFWYVGLLALGIVALLVWSLVMSYQSSVIVYEINDTENENEVLSGQIAAYETQYHAMTQQYVQNENGGITDTAVAYSTRDDNVRYAQVGGAVYSMLTTY